MNAPTARLTTCQSSNGPRCGALFLRAALILFSLHEVRAEACENTNHQGDVVGVAEDGRFVYFEANSVEERVALYDRNAKQRAECKREQEEEAWACSGEIPGGGRRVPKSLTAQKLAERWTGAISVTPLVPAANVPKGISDVFCARVPTNPHSGERYSCEKGKTAVLANPRSQLVFFRYDFAFQFCGESDFERDVIWHSRAELTDRLRKRAASFTKKRKLQHADEVLAALQWLLPDDEAARTQRAALNVNAAPAPARPVNAAAPR